MGAVLITGASGFIGRALAQSLAKTRDVVCMSRRNPQLDVPFLQGDFQSFEDLRMLDQYDLDSVVHLGAETGNGPERAGILVNVEGTRCLMRYLVERGCRQFVMASSIAAMGIQNVRCRPVQVPIPDEHPCTEQSGYGLSKYFMEELTKYFHRQYEDIDVVNFRFSVITPDENPAPLCQVGPICEWALGNIAVMCLSDTLRLITLALDAPRTPGVRIMNATAPVAWTKDPVADVLRGWYGAAVDVSYFEQAGHEWDSVYDVNRVRETYGFVAERLPKNIFGKEVETNA